MRATLKVFGSTLGQVVACVEAARGPATISRAARVLTASLALAAAVDLAHADGDTGPGADYQPASAASASEFANGVKDKVGSAASAVGDKVSGMSSEAKNTGARIIGGIGGAVIGNKIASGASTLWRGVATLGGAFAGERAGNALVPNDKAVAQASTQSKQSIQDRFRYDSAVTETFASAPKPGPHALPADVHANVAQLLTTYAASRIVLGQAMKDVDEREMASASAPSNSTLATAFVAAKRNFEQARTAYNADKAAAVNVVQLGYQKGFDVTAQKTLLSSVSQDMRAAPGRSVEWPGVQQKAVALAERAGVVVNYAALVEQAEASSGVAMRDRGERERAR